VAFVIGASFGRVRVPAAADVERVEIPPLGRTPGRRQVAASCQRLGVSHWDAAILEAARSLGCDVVLSEDLSDGQDYAGVRVENPFRAE
jgi:predicted nucleic acid-binding protein